MKKNIYKKIISISMAAVFMFSIVGCSNNGNTNDSTDQNSKDNVEATSGETDTTISKEVNSRPQPDWVSTAILYEVNVRQYTEEGTFKAFEENLTRLKEMGVNTLWFMPINTIAQEQKKGTLGSYYAIADYKGVNEEFGNLEDFKQLVNKAHEMGFKVILDWVANHTGWDHAWISEHPDWYLKDSDGTILSPPGQDWTDVAQLDYENKELWTEMIDVMKYWITETDIDGFRCDYVQGVPIDFWNEARETLNSEKEIFMLAEDGTQSKAMLVSAFDCNYNFSLYDMILSVAKGGSNAGQLIYKIAGDFPDGAFSMNFIENHDKNSWDGSMKDRFGEESINALTALIFTAEGMPLIYSGQEEGITKVLSFFDKDIIPWSDYKYENIINKLCKIKTQYSALYNGDAGAALNELTSDNVNLLAFDRSQDGKKITVIINLSDEEQTGVIDDKVSDGGTVLLHGTGGSDPETEDTAISAQGVLDLTTFNPWEYYIIVSDLEK